MPSGGGFGDNFDAAPTGGAGFADAFGDDDFEPSGAPGTSSVGWGSTRGLIGCFTRIASGGSTLEALAQVIFDQVHVDEENCISGAEARPLLLKCGTGCRGLGLALPG